MSVDKAYQALIDHKNLSKDPEQLKAVQVLNELVFKINQDDLEQKFSKFSTKGSTIVPAIKGVYLYGRVGRGKTMLMDLFYQQLNIEKKKRIHFHHFMEDVHNQLNKISGQAEPLTQIAKKWSSKVDVLCFDEFFVTDIGDAMLLAGLLKALFTQGMILIATSNCHPDLLYRNGLQRQRFLPTIEIIKQYCQLVSVDGDKDHRLALLVENSSYRDYYFPCEITKRVLANKFIEFTGQCDHSGGQIILHGRSLNYVAKGDAIIWFDFFELCSGPRSQRDYIALADKFSIVLLANVPQFSGKLIPAVFSGVEDGYQRSGNLLENLRILDDEARRFVALVDEFYDRKVRLVITAEVDIAHLYHGEQLSFEFARCQSRLFEMQASSYIIR